MKELILSGQDLYNLMISLLNRNQAKGNQVKRNQECKLKILCRGNSMAPFIRDKNILTLESKDENQAFKKGDIVVTAVHKRKRILIHRIINVHDDKYLIKGDNNKESDGWFEKEDLLGIVHKIENQSGVGYHPKPWQNYLIALASKFNLLRQLLLPVRFLNEPLKTKLKKLRYNN